ncbi:hypothetical protein SAMN05428944_0245 [Streptomyces sp. 1222.5]|uniref:hypothetical protein n=1 Tax=unclassified Streptomyces TaxID=2593676 RepID=UPI00089CE4E2|nr:MULTISPECIES: hypothetical protein [unclassified Streptomyces]PKW12481.1 hypothetical protein BX260_7848 [Streptomyces sp. 5112.2]SEB55622.1 hypothetical protein SAMN05428944_0245 [Streptomyces sp. 1222.5]
MPRDQHSPASAHPDPPSTPGPPPARKPPLLSQRTALILFIAVVGGIGVGLTFLSEKSYPTAYLAGIGGAAACTAGLHQLIE